MLRTALQQGRSAARAAGPNAGANLMRPVGTSSVATATNIENEQWVETDVDVARGVVEFSDPLTVEELEKALEICRFNASSSNSNGTVDPDEQMQSLHVHNNSLYRRVENSFMDLATKLASSESVQAACLEEINKNPEVYKAFSEFNKHFNIQTHRVGEPLGDSNVPLLPPAERAESEQRYTWSDTPTKGSAQPDFLGSILEVLSATISSVSSGIVNYIGRLHVRLHRLVLRIRGIDPDAPHGEGTNDTAGPQAVDQQHYVQDFLYTATILIVVVGLLMRFPMAQAAMQSQARGGV